MLQKITAFCKLSVYCATGILLTVDLDKEVFFALSATAVIFIEVLRSLQTTASDMNLFMLFGRPNNKKVHRMCTE